MDGCSMILTFASQKGGAGKTTGSITVAYEYASSGFRVLLVDTDRQQSILDWNADRGDDMPLPDTLSIAAMTGTKLHKDINKIIQNFDHIIIDTPGEAFSGEIARSAALISDVVIIPCVCSAKAVRSTKKTIRLMKEMRLANTQLKVFFLFNHVEATSMRKRIEPMVLEALGDEIVLMKTEISKRVLYDKADLEGLTIQEADKNKEVVLEIRRLIEEIENG
jgi:chromosome partitioning protein